MRSSVVFFLLALFFAGRGSALAQSAATAPNAPLPNATEILQRALANARKIAVEKERYECRVTDNFVETDSQGNPKKITTVVSDRFYVNGIAIERTLQKNGKDLTPEQAKEEDDRVMKETQKYSNPATAQEEKNKHNQNFEETMEATMLTNGHRERVGGRSVLFYDIVPNPGFQAKTLNQRMARVLQGKISIDEQTGELIDVDVKTVADLKIGGGLLANVHKGVWFHVHSHPEPDGVWLNDLAEGSGDARAALFIHLYRRFKETTDNCSLYTATAAQVGPAQPVKKP